MPSRVMRLSVFQWYNKIMPVAIELLNLKYKGFAVMTTVSIAWSKTFLKKKRSLKLFIKIYDLQCMLCIVTNKKFS